MCGLVPAAAKVIHRKPVFDEVLNAMWRNELVFHLRLETPTLELNVLAAAVGQFVNPNVAVVVGAPGPGLLTRHLTVVGDVDYAPVSLVVINTEVVTSRVAGEKRQKVWHVGELAHVNTLLFRKGEDGPESVRVGFTHGINEAHVVGGGRARGRPEPVATRNFSPVVERYFRFDDPPSGAQPNDDLPLHPLHAFGVADRDGSTSVRLRPHHVINRRNRS